MFSLLAAALMVSACTASGRHASPPVSPPVSTATATTLPLPSAPAVVRGRATFDGSSFDAPFVGAVVRRGGLMTPCETSFAPVQRGRFEIGVLGAGRAAGCGQPGSEILLWTFVRSRQYFATTSVPWPARGSVTFDPQFLSATPNGVATSRSEFSGRVFDHNGNMLPPGARVEAYVSGTRCGIASVRRSAGFTGYRLTVVGPDSIPGCTRGANIEFRVNGIVALTKSVNDERTDPSLDVTLP
jgi:hypothetical protein